MKPIEIDTDPLDWAPQERRDFVKNCLTTVFAGDSLTRREARTSLLLVLEGALGEATDSSFGALFAAIMARGEPTVDEVLGFLDVVLWYDRSERYVPDVDDTVGIVGSGKDDYNTFNVSTGASLVAAACGAPVVKNGSRSESSVAGTTDVMEYLGVEIAPDDAAIERSLDRAGMTFVDAAPSFPRMGERYVGKFLFINPLSYALSIASGVEFDHIVFGLSSPKVEFTGRLLDRLGFEDSFVVNGRLAETDDHIDELSVVGETLLSRVTDDGVTRERVRPESLGLARHDPATIAQGSTVEECTETLLDAVAGPEAERGHPPTDMVVANAAPALVSAGVVDSLEEGIERGYDAVAESAPMRVLERLVAASGGDPDRLETVRREVSV